MAGSVLFLSDKACDRDDYLKPLIVHLGRLAAINADYRSIGGDETLDQGTIFFPIAYCAERDKDFGLRCRPALESA